MKKIHITQRKEAPTQKKKYIYIPWPTALGHEYENVFAGCAIFSSLSRRRHVAAGHSHPPIHPNNKVPREDQRTLLSWRDDLAESIRSHALFKPLTLFLFFHSSSFFSFFSIFISLYRFLSYFFDENIFVFFPFYFFFPVSFIILSYFFLSFIILFFNSPFSLYPDFPLAGPASNLIPPSYPPLSFLLLFPLFPASRGGPPANGNW